MHRTSYRKHEYSGKVGRKRSVGALQRWHGAATKSHSDKWRSEIKEDVEVSRESDTPQPSTSSVDTPRPPRTYAPARDRNETVRRPLKEVQYNEPTIPTAGPSNKRKRPLKFEWPVDPDVEKHELVIEPEAPNTGPALSGYRVVDIQHVFHWCLNLQKSHSSVCTGCLIEFVSEKRDGLRSTFRFKCNMCNEEFQRTSESADRINKAFVWGTLTGGSYYSQANNLLSSMDVPTMSSKKFRGVEQDLGTHWEEHLYEEMRKAGEEEKEIAIKKGHVGSDGVPYIMVYVDGGWSKRSYGHNFNAASGTACIIGVETQKCLYVGVRNKFCSICAQNEKRNEEKIHKCFRNYKGSSTGMEADMLVEGFTKSIEMHGLRYTSFVGDGDSSVFARLTQKVPYGNLIKKKECKNHVSKNYTGSLYKLALDTKMPIEARKILMPMISKLTTVARIQMKQSNAQKMRKDLQNGPFHVFGDHENCEQYYCRYKKDPSIEKDENVVPVLKKHISFWAHLETAINNICRKADRLVDNISNNVAENFMSLMAKYNCGKRLNLTQRGSFNRRAHLTGLTQISGQKWQSAAWQKKLKQKPGIYFEKYLERQEKIAILRAKNKRTFKPPSKPGPSADKDYGPKADDVPPEIPDEELKELCQRKLKELQIDDLETIEEIQKKTIGQHGNADFDELRKDRLTASQFGMISKRRSGTPCHNHVKAVLYKNFFGNADTKYGQTFEKVAIRLFEIEKQKKVIPAGLFIDHKYGFLGASPDGIVTDENALVEVKTFPSLAKSGQTIEEAAQTKKGFCLQIKDGQLELKTNHNFYYQIQGQLYVARKEKCYLVLFISEAKPITVLEIQKNEEFIEFFLPKLKSFYIDCILPEIILRRIPANHKCKEPTK